ncbi:MAG: hypothetical protein FWG25_08750 [Promicromonosporaceae bacterium]|nr:hypothetical protein [Promicromonosporaceae bacterium]
MNNQVQGFALADSIELDASGTVQPVAKWVEGPDGKRVRTEEQAANDAGMLLWLILVS